MKRRWYILAALTAFLGSLIFKAPAATFYGWLIARQLPATCVVYGLQGSISEGRAAGIYLDGHPALGDFHWTLQAWRLLLAQAAFKIDGGGEQTSLDGALALLPTGGINLSDFHARTGVKALLTAIGQPYLPMDGRTVLDISSVKIRNHQFRQAEGRIQVQGLAWTLAASPVTLGDFNAAVSTDHDNILLKIESAGPGPLEVSGEGKLGPDQSYEVHLQLRSRPDANPMVRNLISSIGTPDSQGWSHLRQQGRLQ